MKVYDITLALIRALVAFDLIRETGTLLFAVLRMSFLLSSPNLRAVEMASVGSAVFSILTLLVIWAASRPIARFAARFAKSADVAAHF